MNYILLLTWIATASSSSSTSSHQNRGKNFHPHQRISLSHPLSLPQSLCETDKNIDSIVNVWTILWFSRQVWFDCMILIHSSIIGGHLQRRGNLNFPSDFFIYDLTKIPPFEPSIEHWATNLIHTDCELTNSTNTKYRINFTEISIYTLGPFRLQPPLPPLPPPPPPSSSLPPPIFPVRWFYLISFFFFFFVVYKYLFSFLYKHSVAIAYLLPVVFIYFIFTASIVTQALKMGKLSLSLSYTWK